MLLATRDMVLALFLLTTAVVDLVEALRRSRFVTTSGSVRRADLRTLTHGFRTFRDSAVRAEVSLDTLAVTTVVGSDLEGTVARAVLTALVGVGRRLCRRVVRRLGRIFTEMCLNGGRVVLIVLGTVTFVDDADDVALRNTHRNASGDSVML